MPRFDRYLLSQLTVLFGFFSLVLISVYWVNRAVILFDQLIADGQSAGVFLEFTALSLPNVVRMVLPISAFIAAVYVTNRLSSESELVVAQSSGVSAFRMARPVVLFGVLVAALMIVLVHLLVPVSRAQLAEREVEISSNVTARLLTEGQFIHPAEGITFYLREITQEGELLDVFLSDARSDTSRVTYIARRAFLVAQETGPKLVMFNGTAHTFSLDDQKLFTTSFDDFSYDISSLIQFSGNRDVDLRELGTPALFATRPADLERTGASRAAFLYEAHLRLTQPFNGLVTALIGFAALMVGGFSRFGVWKQIFLALLLLIVVQVLENVAMSAVRGDENLWPLVYMPNLVGLAIACGLLTLADRPALFRRVTRATT